MTDKDSMYYSWISRPGFPGHFFALAAGALLPFSFAPYFVWPLGLLSIALFYVSLKNITAKDALWRGWWYGFGVFASGVSWVYVSIHIYSHTPAPLAVLFTLVFVSVLAWFFAFMAYTYQKFFSQYSSSAFIAFAAVWLLFEWLRSWFLTGFPWLFVGDAHLDTSLKGFAPVFGVYGISFIVALLSAFIVEQIQSGNLKQQWLRTLTIILAPWLIGASLSLIQWSHEVENGDLNVIAVQGNIAQERKWLPEEIYPTLEKYRGASQQHWQDADVILWPETAVTVLHHQATEYINFLDDEAKQNNVALLTGIPYQQQQEEPYPGAFHNSIMAIGQGEGIYHKQKLVPFGEYLPLPDAARGLLDFFNIPMSDFRTGTSDQSILTAQSGEIEYGIAPFICYEIVYPDFVASMAKTSGLMVTISNDAWFGHSNGPLQHMAMARMRALETGRYLLRSTNTGVTALINPQGKVINQLPQFEYGVLKAEAKIMAGSTPFMLWGSWPMVLLCMGLLLYIQLRNNKLKKFEAA